MFDLRKFCSSCTDLGDSDLQLHVVKGINLPLPDGYAPNQLNTYLKYEFPIPKVHLKMLILIFVLYFKNY